MKDNSNSNSKSKWINGKTLKEWEFEKGIEIKAKNRGKISKKAITEGRFKRLIGSSFIVVKTDKGLEYLSRIREMKGVR